MLAPELHTLEPITPLTTAGGGRHLAATTCINAVTWWLLSSTPHNPSHHLLSVSSRMLTYADVC